jgi:hypothetical protein
MLTRHSNELSMRLERVADVGCAEIANHELVRWYDQQKVTRNIWRDIHDKWLDTAEKDATLLVGWSDDRWVFVEGTGLTVSASSWLTDVKELAKREGHLVSL